MLLKCPRCGRGKVFRRFVIMNETCTHCGLVFDRGQGYWLGAMMFNMAFAIGTLLVTFLVALWATSPDPDWNVIVIVTVTASIVVPLAFFPFSRSLWIAAERSARLRDGVEAE